MVQKFKFVWPSEDDLQTAKLSDLSDPAPQPTVCPPWAGWLGSSRAVLGSGPRHKQLRPGGLRGAGMQLFKVLMESKCCQIQCLCPVLPPLLQDDLHSRVEGGQVEAGLGSQLGDTHCQGQPTLTASLQSADQCAVRASLQSQLVFSQSLCIVKTSVQLKLVYSQDQCIVRASLQSADQCIVRASVQLELVYSQDQSLDTIMKVLL